MLLSIIIPIYNVEKYIRRCLDSIFSQNVDTNDYEVICVNDGTPDNSMSIVIEYAGRYTNLHIIDQKNQGLSVARNNGMAMAKGEYLWFVDSDDDVSEQSLSEVKSIISVNDEAEIICTDICNVVNGKQIYESVFTKDKYKMYYGEEHDGYFYCRKLPTGIVQRFLFKRTFLSANSLHFTPGIYHEDQDFLYRCYTKAKRILPIDKTWYNYYVRESGSITSTFKIKRFYDIMEIIKNFDALSLKSQDCRQKSILQEGICSLAYGLLSSKYRGRDDYDEFLSKNKKELKRYLITSYFKSIRKNSLGKTYRLFISFL